MSAAGIEDSRSLELRRPERGLSGLTGRLRCWLLPPRNAVFISGAWRPVVPVLKGPGVAMFGDRAVPGWWLLSCGRLAEFVGIHDGRPVLGRRDPVRRGEVVIDDVGVYRISDWPIGHAATYACFETGESVRPGSITVWR